MLLSLVVVFVVVVVVVVVFVNCTPRPSNFSSGCAFVFDKKNQFSRWFGLCEDNSPPKNRVHLYGIRRLPPIGRVVCVPEPNDAPFWGKPRYSLRVICDRNSSVAPSDFDRLISRHRLAQAALLGDSYCI